MQNACDHKSDFLEIKFDLLEKQTYRFVCTPFVMLHYLEDFTTDSKIEIPLTTMTEI